MSLLYMKQILLLTSLLLTVSLVAAEKPYDFRASEAYRLLSTTDRQGLQKVHRDLALLWGALDMYADNHKGMLPETLDELAPKYLAELPSDPFATEETASLKTSCDIQSKNGMGYRFRKGALGNQAWVISSVGLTKFPYLSQRGNVDLYACKGTWISGMNPIMLK